VPPATAIEQARGRWWAGRIAETILGGRFLSDTTISDFYAADGSSLCAAHARDFFEAANDFHLDAELALVTRDENNVAHISMVSPGGEVQSVTPA
jgi:hypothetical protein